MSNCKARNVNGYTDTDVLNLTIQQSLFLNSDGDTNKWNIQEAENGNDNLQFIHETATTTTTAMELEPDGDITFNGSATFNGGFGLLGDLDMNNNDIINVGNIGIGTNVPSEFLEIRNTSGGNTYQQFTTSLGQMDIGLDGNDNGTIVVRTVDDLNFGTNNSIKMTIDSSGNVGIGTNTPSALLDVNGTSEFNGNITLTNADILTSNSGLFFDYSAKQLSVAGLPEGTNSITARGSIYAEAYNMIGSGTMDLNGGNIIDATRIGIGTDNPNRALLVRSNDEEIVAEFRRIGANSPSVINVLNSSSSSSRLRMGYDESGISDNVLSAQVIAEGNDLLLSGRTNTASGIRFYTNPLTTANERMRITSDGDVGIGITNPSTLLDVNGDITANNFIGTISTASQPNITSLGTLTSLTMGGTFNMNSNNITNGGTITSTNFTGTLTTASQPNITSLGTLTGLTMGGALNLNSNNITNGGTITATSFSGNLTGTIQTASQPNITSLGTLTGLTMGGTLDMVNNNIDNINELIGNTTLTLDTTGTNDLIMQTNNTERMRIDSSGNVGVGTNNPVEKLEINSSSEDVLGVYNTAGGTDNSFINIGDSLSRLQIGYTEDNLLSSNSTPSQIVVDTSGNIKYSARTNFDADHIFYTRSGTTATERMRILGGTNGYVGIGIANPVELLDVNGDARVRGDLTVDGTLTTTDTETVSTEASLFRVGTNNTADTIDIGLYGHYVDTGITKYSGFFRDATDGKYQLFTELQDTPTTTVNTAGTGYTIADLEVGELTATDLTADTNMVFNTNGNERMRINSSGRVGIGTTNPGDLLHLYTTSGNTYSRYANSSGGNFIVGIDGSENGTLYVRTADDMNFGTNNTLRMKITSTGNVGIGTAIPSTPLDVVGDINTSTDYNIGGTQVLSSTTLGSGVVNSSLTSLGTLSSLTMGGALNLNSNNITNGGTISGTLTTASQPNITSLGTLTGLTMGGTLNMNSNNITNIDTISSSIITLSGIIDIDGNEVTNVNKLKGQSTADLDIESSGSRDIDFVTNGLLKMVIKNDGKVGIGTGTPDRELEVNGEIGGNNLVCQTIGSLGYILLDEQNYTLAEGTTFGSNYNLDNQATDNYAMYKFIGWGRLNGDNTGDSLLQMRYRDTAGDISESNGHWYSVVNRSTTVDDGKSDLSRLLRFGSTNGYRQFTIDLTIFTGGESDNNNVSHTGQLSTNDVNGDNRGSFSSSGGLTLAGTSANRITGITFNGLNIQTGSSLSYIYGRVYRML